MTLDAKAASLALADAYWWLRGFCSAQPGNIEAADAAARIARVRRWMESLENGGAIVIVCEPERGQPERYVISENQLERLADGSRENAGDQDKADARAVAAEMLAAIRQARASNNTDLPF